MNMYKHTYGDIWWYMCKMYRWIEESTRTLQFFCRVGDTTKIGWFWMRWSDRGFWEVMLKIMVPNSSYSWRPNPMLHGSSRLGLWLGLCFVIWCFRDSSYSWRPYSWQGYAFKADNFIWLVVDLPRTPLNNMKVNWDDDIPDVWKNGKCSNPPSSYITYGESIWLQQSGNTSSADRDGVAWLNSHRDGQSSI